MWVPMFNKKHLKKDISTETLEYNKEDRDNSPNILSDKIYQALSQKC